MPSPLPPNLKKILPTNKGSIEHERLNSLINSMGDGVIAIDENQKIVMYNGAALNILDLNESMTGQYLSVVLKVIDKNNQPVDVSKMVAGSSTATFSRDYRLQYPDKSTVSLYISVAPVRLGYGQRGTKGYVVLLRDITREKSLEEERDEFISVVSHELRTPIAIAEGNVGNAQVIAEKSGDLNQIKEALKQAHDQILFLSGMINDLSTLSRAERGKLAVEVESINVHELLTSLLSLYKPQAEEKGLTLAVELDPSLELLQSSSLYVREIIQNFVTNAIKYTETGGVTISAKKVPTGVEFAIHDTGIGISKGDQEKIFDKFFRSEDYRTRQNNGTGLGLYVTLKLARLIHADISMSSELNKGSTFKIVVPNLQ
jgi:two-component system phosphate regulon sensor histidine kinase PhoR